MRQHSSRCRPEAASHAHPPTSLVNLSAYKSIARWLRGLLWRRWVGFGRGTPVCVLPLKDVHFTMSKPPLTFRTTNAPPTKTSSGRHSLHVWSHCVCWSSASLASSPCVWQDLPAAALRGTQQAYRVVDTWVHARGIFVQMAVNAPVRNRHCHDMQVGTLTCGAGLLSLVPSPRSSTLEASSSTPCHWPSLVISRFCWTRQPQDEDITF